MELDIEYPKEYVMWYTDHVCPLCFKSYTLEYAYSEKPFDAVGIYCPQCGKYHIRYINLVKEYKQ